MTHATYPNEDAFEGTVNFCLVLKKLLNSCSVEKRGPLDLKFPKLCPEVVKEEEVIQQLDCNAFEDGGGNGDNSSDLVLPHFI